MKALDATAIILSGGHSRRMGREKAAIRVDGEQLIERIVRLLRPLFCEIVIVLGHEHEERVEGVRYARDRESHQGPLAGLSAGLESSKTELNFLHACDMPLINLELVRFLAGLIDGNDVVVPRSRGGLEPLHAFYGRTCLTEVNRALERDERKVSSFYPYVRVREVGMDEMSAVPGAEQAFLDLNTEEELRRVARMLEE